MENEILEGNKLIAEKLFNAVLNTTDPMFMGGNVPHYTLIVDGVKRNYTPYELKFHKSFDWIIRAVNRLPWNTGAKQSLFSNDIYCKRIFDDIVEWLKKSDL